MWGPHDFLPQSRRAHARRTDSPPLPSPTLAAVEAGCPHRIPAPSRTLPTVPPVEVDGGTQRQARRQHRSTSPTTTGSAKWLPGWSMVWVSSRRLTQTAAPPRRRGAGPHTVAPQRGRGSRWSSRARTTRSCGARAGGGGGVQSEPRGGGLLHLCRQGPLHLQEARQACQAPRTHAHRGKKKGAIRMDGDEWEVVMAVGLTQIIF